MKPGKLTRPSLPDKTVTQNIVLDKIESEEKTIIGQNTANIQRELTPQEAAKVIADLVKSFEKNAVYNQVLDEKLMFGANDEGYDPAAVNLLRQDNRKRVKEIKAKVENLITNLDKQLETIDYDLPYDVKSDKQKSLMDYYYPDHNVGLASYPQSKTIKSKKEQIAQIKADVNLNKFYYKSKSGKYIDIEEKHKEFKEEVIGWLFSNFKKNDAKYIAAEAANPGSGAAIEVGYRAYLFTLFQVEDIENTSFAEAVDELTRKWEGEEMVLNEDNVSTKIALIPLRDSANEIRHSASFIETTLGTVDEQNSYVDVLFQNKEPLNVGFKGRKFTFDYDDVLSNCFDCFLDGAWKGTKSFKLGIEFEFDAAKLLNNLAFLLEKIMLALDTEFLIKQNYCSLARLGTLCPIEIAFLAASIMAMIRFTWQEVVLNFSGFLGELIAMILGPLLDSLKLGLRFSFSPWEVYAGCTSKSIVSLMDINKAFPDPGSGWSMSEMSAAQNEKPPTTDREKALLKKWSEYSQKLTNIQRADLQEGVNSFAGYLRDFDISKTEPSKKPEKASTGEEVVNFLSNVAFVENGDIVEVFNMALKGAGKMLENNCSQITAAIEGLNNWLNSKTASRIQIAAKIMAFSTLYSVLGALMELASRGIDICIKLPVYDDQGNEIGFTTESPFSSAEIAELMEDATSTVMGKPQPDIIVENNIGLKDIEGKNAAQLYNPLTDRRFNLTNCDKAKSSIISKGETLDFWKKIALGVNIDNV
jgi:hypothetical protein